VSSEIPAKTPERMNLMQNTQKMPVLFVGHGSPMNAIGENRAREGWRRLAASLPEPRAIVAVSAHWQTEGVRVRTAADNPQIYDMYGFPETLYRVKYAPAGDPELARRVLALLGEQARGDNSWGIDHGVWSVLSNLFPGADVPVVMVSVDPSLPDEAQRAVGRKLACLRDEGVMLAASGNVVHSLRLVDWSMAGGFDWADSFDGSVRKRHPGRAGAGRARLGLPSRCAAGRADARALRAAADRAGRGGGAGPHRGLQRLPRARLHVHDLLSFRIKYWFLFCGFCDKIMTEIT
jgi:4,5-DOPA dioxygenase extradiol